MVRLVAHVIAITVSACALAGCAREYALDVGTAAMRREMARACELSDPNRLDRDCDHWRDLER